MSFMYMRCLPVFSLRQPLGSLLHGEGVVEGISWVRVHYIFETQEPANTVDCTLHLFLKDGICITAARGNHLGFRDTQASFSAWGRFLEVFTRRNRHTSHLEVGVESLK